MKKTMKRLALLCAMLLVSLDAISQKPSVGGGSGHSVMIVSLKDGTKQAITLADQPTLNDDGGLITISFSENDKDFVLSYDRTLVKEVTFESDPSAIDELTAEPAGKTIHIDARNLDQIRLSGLTPGCRVQVFSANGTVVPAAVSQSASEATVSLTAQPRGLYIIRASRDCSFKIQKR